MLNYFYDCYNILNKVYGEKTFLKQAILSTEIEEKNRALTIKTCYGVLDKDIELSYYVKNLTDKSPKAAIRIILKVAMYAIKYLNKRVYAVTLNAVELTKKLGKGGASGFVNAFLRKFSEIEFVFPKKKSEYLSVKYSYPEFAVEELIRDYGEDRAEKIISAGNDKSCLSFYDVNGEEYLNSLGVDYEKTPFKNVFLAKNFLRNADYDKGLYTYQAIGSVAICEAVEKSGRLLDCCAAPGGKSVRLSYKFGEVVSVDVHEHRVNLIKDYIKRMKRENVFPCVGDAKIFNEEFKNAFDAVLCDVPCSGLGVVNDNPDIKLNRKKEDIVSLNIEQLEILKNVSSYVKPGGYLYYSTCSVLYSENIMIIKQFMRDIKGFVIEKAESDLPHLSIDGTLQFLPDISFGSGFYFAKLKRVK